jgi:hypothetical protein
MVRIDKFFKFTRPVEKLGLFIAEVIVSTIILFFIIGVVLYSFEHIFNLEAILAIGSFGFGDIVLLVTASFILVYTYETKKTREQALLHNKMSYAHDVNFSMSSDYSGRLASDSFIGKINSPEMSTNVSRVLFLSGVFLKPFGRCAPFIKNKERERLEANCYFDNPKEDREIFLGELKRGNGEIRASVLMTNVMRFIYTFKAVQGCWIKTIEGHENLRDDFILVKKELDDI